MLVASTRHRKATMTHGWIDTLGWFCYQNLCPMVVGHTVTYVDQAHISQTYATQLVTVFRRAFRRQLFG
jgi:hypothetical protein